MRRVLTTLLVVVATFTATSCAMAPGPALPGNVKWTEPPTLPPGAKLAVLAGNPSQPGLSTYRLWFPGNYKVPAHFHPVTENVTVVSGTIYLGMGDKLDMSKGTAYPAGSFATVGRQHAPLRLDQRRNRDSNSPGGSDRHHLCEPGG